MMVRYSDGRFDVELRDSPVHRRSVLAHLVKLPECATSNYAWEVYDPPRHPALTLRSIVGAALFDAR